MNTLPFEITSTVFDLLSSKAQSKLLQCGRWQGHEEWSRQNKILLKKRRSSMIIARCLLQNSNQLQQEHFVDLTENGYNPNFGAKYENPSYQKFCKRKLKAYYRSHPAYRKKTRANQLRFLHGKYRSENAEIQQVRDKLSICDKLRFIHVSQFVHTMTIGEITDHGL